MQYSKLTAANVSFTKLPSVPSQPYVNTIQSQLCCSPSICRILIRHGDKTTYALKKGSIGGNGGVLKGYCNDNGHGSTKITVEQIESRMLQCITTPLPPAQPNMVPSQEAIERNQFHNFCKSFSPQEIDRSLLLLEFEGMMAEKFPDKNWRFDDRIYVEEFDRNSFVQVFPTLLLFYLVTNTTPVVFSC